MSFIVQAQDFGYVYTGSLVTEWRTVEATNGASPLALLFFSEQ